MNRISITVLVKCSSCESEAQTRADLGEDNEAWWCQTARVQAFDTVQLRIDESKTLAVHRPEGWTSEMEHGLWARWVCSFSTTTTVPPACGCPSRSRP